MPTARLVIATTSAGEYAIEYGLARFTARIQYWWDGWRVFVFHRPGGPFYGMRRLPSFEAACRSAEAAVEALPPSFWS